MSRLTVLPALAALALTLGACGGGSEPSADGSGTPSASASPSASAPAGHGSGDDAFNPCDALDAGPVSRALGAEVSVQADASRCALVPARKGDPVMQLNYSIFPAGLAAAWDTMKIPAGEVRTPRIAGAEDARVVVNRRDDAYLVSAFLQTGSLIQSVNATALAPYAAGKVDAAVTVVLEQLAAGAPDLPAPTASSSS